MELLEAIELEPSKSGLIESGTANTLLSITCVAGSQVIIIIKV